MKKFLSLLALALLCVGGWAQTFPDLPDLSNYVIASTPTEKITSADSITASTSESTQWYVITQTRGGETPVYDNGAGYARRAMTSNTVSTVLAKNTLVSDVTSYLVRFIDSGITNSDDGNKGYYIQYATGNKWYNSSNAQNNELQASADNATCYLVYTATNTTSDNSGTGFAFTYTTDGTYGYTLNNTAASSTGDASVHLYNNGKIESNANAVFYVYPVEIEVATSFTYTITVFGADGGAAMINSTEYATSSTYTSSTALTASDISAKTVDGYTSTVTLSGYSISIIYTPDISSKVIQTVGDKLSSANISASQWYVITGCRTSGNEYGTDTPFYDNNGYVYRASSGNGVSTLLAEGTEASSVTQYLVRFIDANVTGTSGDYTDKGYYIQFADGNAFYNSSNEQSNGVQAITVDDETYATIYLVYTATQSNQSTTGFCFNYTTDGSYGYRFDGNGAGSSVILWGSGRVESGQNDVFYIYPVTLVDENDYIDYAGLQTLINSVEGDDADYTVGTGLGEYTYTGTEDWATKIAGYQAMVTNANSSQSEVETAKTELQTMINALSLNLPTDGMFLRIKSYAGSYLKAANNETGSYSGRAGLAESVDDAGIFYYDGTYLLAYSGGYYLDASATGTRVAYSSTVGSNTPFEFKESQISTGCYAIKFTSNNRYLYAESASNGRTDAGNFNSDPYQPTGSSNVNYDFYLEQVTSLSVSLGASGTTSDNTTTAYYGTITLPVDATIPDGLTVYTAALNSEDSNDLTLSEITDGTIPANTPVVLYSTTSSSFDLPVSTTISTSGSSALSGTIAKEAASTEEGVTTFVLSAIDSEVAFYKYTGTNIPGFKAYYKRTSSTSANQFNIVFPGGDDDDLTAVEGIDAAGSDAASSAPYYDLQGRKVTSPVKGQIYIHAGKKVLY